MYKYLFIVGLTLVRLNACELMAGVTIQDPKVNRLFETATELYKDDKVTRATIENLYEQYLCLLASRDKKDAEPLSDSRIISSLRMLIESKS